MNFKTGDKVVVIAGKDKGKEGKIINVLRKENRELRKGIKEKDVKKNAKGTTRSRQKSK